MQRNQSTQKKNEIMLYKCKYRLEKIVKIFLLFFRFEPISFLRLQCNWFMLVYGIEMMRLTVAAATSHLSRSVCVSQTIFCFIIPTYIESFEYFIQICWFRSIYSMCILRRPPPVIFYIDSIVYFSRIRSTCDTQIYNI